ncbi:hypothetical protein MAR_001458 [Mya arenaria]|uniref:Uncharacterized protein n=1 Tax=Mya arenaria TaxID=6604 RepID=A0ABY7FBZ9_MYAAR|nr:uncharacterized protein LOC128209667 [Mya arenaria]WAR19620.1 hypothetical protein MAR_001458 [Mya arenaria]
MVDCLYFTIGIALIVPFVGAANYTCEDGSLNGLNCSTGCCSRNVSAGIWKCCSRYDGYNPPARGRIVFIDIGISIGIVVILSGSICCCICCLKKLRRKQRHTEQTETASVCQQPDRAQPLQPLQAISCTVVRDHIAMQDPPPYELLGANCSSEPLQVVNMQSVIYERNGIGKPPPYELRRDNYSNEPSLRTFRTGNMVQSSTLSNRIAEPPPYELGRDNYSNEPSLQTGNMVSGTALSICMAEPPPYSEVIANCNYP